MARKAQCLTAQYNKYLDVAVSCRFVRQILLEHEDLRYVKLKVKPPLLPRPIKARLGGVRESVLWTVKNGTLSSFETKKNVTLMD